MKIIMLEKSILSIVFFMTFMVALSAKLDTDISVYKTKEEFEVELKKRLAKRLKQIGQGNITNFANDLIKKEKLIKLKELEILKKEDEIRLTQVEINKKLKNFSDKQEKILGCITDNENKVQKRVNHIVEIISTMKPQKSADLLTVQDIEIAIKIIGMLEAAKLSKIFNVMDKEISARLQKQYLFMKK